MSTQHALDIGLAALRNAAAPPLRNGRVRDAQLPSNGRHGAPGAVEGAMQVHGCQLGSLTATRKKNLTATFTVTAGTEVPDIGASLMPKSRLLTSRERDILARVESLLASRNLSWAELARRCGLSGNSGSQWSGRRVFPREATLHHMAAVLEVEVGWLLTGDKPGERETAQTAAEREALLIIRQMGKDEQRTALAALRGIRGSLTEK